MDDDLFLTKTYSHLSLTKYAPGFFTKKSGLFIAIRYAVENDTIQTSPKPQAREAEIQKWASSLALRASVINDRIEYGCPNKGRLSCR